MNRNKGVKLVMIRNIKGIFIFYLFIGLLFGCGSFVGEKENNIFSRGIPGGSSWVILPSVASLDLNIEDNILLQFERILKVKLPSFGVVNAQLTDIRNRKILQKYKNMKEYTRSVLAFAKIKKAKFAIYIEIHNLEIDISKNCSLDISLTVYNVQDKSPIWYVKGRKSGNNQEDKLSIYRALIADLLVLAPIGNYQL